MTRIFALATAILALAVPARADIVLAAASQSFDEHFSTDTKVSGRFLVGLWLGEPPARIELAATRLLLPAREKPTQVCLNASTRDGEYWMHARYDVPTGAPGPADPAINSHYNAELARYLGADFGVRAELKPDCAQAAPGTFLPALGAAGQPLVLVALINGQHAVRVRMSLALGANQPALKADCRPLADGRSTAFDTVCRLAIPDGLPDGDHVLEIRRRTLAGDDDRDSVAVELAHPPR